MPRSLPWLAQAAKKQVATKPTSSSPAPRNKRLSSPDDPFDEDLNTTGVVTPERRKRTRTTRTPSTSPPPAPPDVEYMYEGFTADDAWMMVEDEFLTVVKTYTQHIHHAEYVRLKKLAESRGTGTLAAIARPTDARTAQSNATKLRLEAHTKDKKMKDGMKGVLNEEESDEEDPYMQDPQLAGLMTASQHTNEDLTKIAKVKSKTRAAAGYLQSPHKKRTVGCEGEAIVDPYGGSPTNRRASAVAVDESTDDDGDLDAPFTKSSKQKPRPPPASPSQGRSIVRSLPSFRGKASERLSILDTTKRSAAKPSEHEQSDLRSRIPRKESTHSRTDYNPEGAPRANEDSTVMSERRRAASDFLAKRRAAKQKREQEEKRKNKHVDQVPTWLI